MVLPKRTLWFGIMIKELLSIASRAGQPARLSVLIFHRVLPKPDHLFPDEIHARYFDEVCGWLKSWFNVMPLSAAVRRLQTGNLPARAACITFDDGYADNHDVAMPVLQTHGLVGTFFVATGFLDGGRMWNDTVIESIRNSRLALLDMGGLGSWPIQSKAEKLAAINAIICKIKYLPLAERLALSDAVATVAAVSPPSNLMMTAAQVKAMRIAGMEIGAHTMSHPILKQLSDEQSIVEIEGSKIFLEHLLGERVGLFAYPNGKPGVDYTAAHVDAVRRLGFDAAVNTAWGTSRTGDDPFQIKRFTPWDRNRLHFGGRMLANLCRR